MCVWLNPLFVNIATPVPQPSDPSYPQFGASTTGGYLGTIVREAGMVEGALVRLDYETRQTLQAALVPRGERSMK